VQFSMEARHLDPRESLELRYGTRLGPRHHRFGYGCSQAPGELAMSNEPVPCGDDACAEMSSAQVGQAVCGFGGRMSWLLSKISLAAA
jgi:hypothetical protein